jgi:hypothetical protein
LRTLPRKEALPILRVLARPAATAQGGTPGEGWGWGWG